MNNIFYGIEINGFIFGSFDEQIAAELVPGLVLWKSVVS